MNRTDVLADVALCLISLALVACYEQPTQQSIPSEPTSESIPDGATSDATGPEVTPPDPGVCGDGIVDEGEDCDEGGQAPSCNADCTVATCGDSIVNALAGEDCDEGGMTAACDSDCTFAGCGDGVINPLAGEACDDIGESNRCDIDCTLVECGDDTINAIALEQCEDGNTDDTDDCVSCKDAACGDGHLRARVEVCDDGNLTDLDGCTNACIPGSIFVSGTSYLLIEAALDALGEPYTSDFEYWPPPLSGGILVMSNAGFGTPIDYQAHLDAGAHLLVIGGSANNGYASWLAGYFSGFLIPSWHLSDECSFDFYRNGAHPITALMPDAYEFATVWPSYHMFHITAGAQSPDTELLAFNCEDGPDNYTMATRRFPSGGTITYLANDIGTQNDGVSSSMFIQPFLEGYLAYVRSPAP